MNKLLTLLIQDSISRNKPQANNTNILESFRVLPTRELINSIDQLETRKKKKEDEEFSSAKKQTKSNKENREHQCNKAVQSLKISTREIPLLNMPCPKHQIENERLIYHKASVVNETSSRILELHSNQMHQIVKK